MTIANVKLLFMSKILTVRKLNSMKKLCKVRSKIKTKKNWVSISRCKASSWKKCRNSRTITSVRQMTRATAGMSRVLQKTFKWATTVPCQLLKLKRLKILTSTKKVMVKQASVLNPEAAMCLTFRWSARVARTTKSSHLPRNLISLSLWGI